jgi:hypothetical protein
VYASAVNLRKADPSMTATLTTRGLDSLLDGYGIHLNRDAVLDHGAALEMDLLTSQGGRAILRHPGVVRPTSTTQAAGRPLLDAGFAGFFRMDEIVLPFCSSLDLQRGKQPADVRVEAVARSTEQVSVETGVSVDMKLRESWPQAAPSQQRILAAYAQGKLQSAFASKPLPGTSLPQRADRPSRLLVVSSSLFVTNPFGYAGNAAEAGSPAADPQLLLVAQQYTSHLTNIIVSVKNTLDWMSGDDDLVAVSAKLIGKPRVAH